MLSTTDKSQHRTHQSAQDRAERLVRTADLLDQANRRQGSDRDERINDVITMNMPVARSIAARFKNRGIALEDLEQVALLGLVKAARGFDSSRGDEFLSYAVPTITGEVKRHFRDAGWAVRPPRRIQELQSSISQAASALSQDLGRSPRPSEIAARIGAKESDVVEALGCGGCFEPSSLDDRGADGDGSSIAERLGERDMGYARAEAVAVLAPLCRDLKERDRHILYLRFFRGYTQEQIAADLGVTQMQVSRLLTRILGSLRDRVTTDDESGPEAPLGKPA